MGDLDKVSEFVIFPQPKSYYETAQIARFTQSGVTNRDELTLVPSDILTVPTRIFVAKSIAESRSLAMATALEKYLHEHLGQSEFAGLLPGEITGGTIIKYYETNDSGDIVTQLAPSDFHGTALSFYYTDIAQNAYSTNHSKSGRAVCSLVLTFPFNGITLTAYAPAEASYYIEAPTGVSLSVLPPTSTRLLDPLGADDEWNVM